MTNQNVLHVHVEGRVGIAIGTPTAWAHDIQKNNIQRASPVSEALHRKRNLKGPIAGHFAFGAQRASEVGRRGGVFVG